MPQPRSTVATIRAGVLAGAVFGGLDTIAQEANTDQIANAVCNSVSDASDTQEAFKSLRLELCVTAIKQRATKGNAALIAMLETVFNQCQVRDMTGLETRLKLYNLKPIEEGTKDDLASVVRCVTYCQMKQYPPNVSNQIYAGTNFYAAHSVVQTYAMDAERKRAEAKQMQEWAARSQALAEDRARREATLRQAGYRIVRLVDLKVDAKSLHGEKVVMSGMVQAINNNMAYMVANTRDTSGVYVLTEQASRDTRQQILSRCNSRPCRMEVKGTVIGDRLEVAIRTD